MSYALIAQWHKKAVSVGRLCRVLGVSRSGYYGWRQRAPRAPQACRVSTQLKAELAASGRVYGSRRLGAILRAQGLALPGGGAGPVPHPGSSCIPTAAANTPVRCTRRC